MLCPKCGHEQRDGLAQCEHCGIIFAKFYSRQQAQQESEAQTAGGFGARFAAIFFCLPEEATAGALYLRLLIFLAVALRTIGFCFSPLADAGDSYLHLINIPFHEAGHVIFIPFGQLLHSLGGTIGQLAMPLACTIALLKANDSFGAAMALWWHGENYLDIAPYIDDARALTLPLLGGNSGENSPYGFHDWEFILGELHLLQYDHFLARLSFGSGLFVMLLSCAWGAYMLLLLHGKLHD